MSQHTTKLLTIGPPSLILLSMKSVRDLEAKISRLRAMARTAECPVVRADAAEQLAKALRQLLAP